MREELAELTKASRGQAELDREKAYRAAEKEYDKATAVAAEKRRKARAVAKAKYDEVASDFGSLMKKARRDVKTTENIDEAYDEIRPETEEEEKEKEFARARAKEKRREKNAKARANRLAGKRNTHAALLRL